MCIRDRAGESNRGVSRKLPIDKETVNGYVNTVKANGWNISDLLEMCIRDRFRGGNPGQYGALARRGAGQ